VAKGQALGSAYQKKTEKRKKKAFVSVKKNLRKIMAAIKNILICHCGL